MPPSATTFVTLTATLTGVAAGVWSYVSGRKSSRRRSKTSQRICDGLLTGTAAGLCAYNGMIFTADPDKNTTDLMLSVIFGTAAVAHEYEIADD